MNQTFQKIVGGVLAVTALMGLSACGSKTEDNKADGKTYKVGIVQFVDDASLNQIEAAIEAELDAKATELGVKFDYTLYNGQADGTTLNQIGAELVSKGVDLIVPIATPAVKIMQSATEDTEIPIVFSAVSDPVGAGIVDSLDAPGGRITGTSDALNTKGLLDLMLAQNPDTKTVGLLYSKSEDSSKQPIEDAKAYLEGKGIRCVEKTGTTTDEHHLVVGFTQEEFTVRTGNRYFVSRFAREDKRRTDTRIYRSKSACRTVERRSGDTDVQHDDIAFCRRIGHGVSPVSRFGIVHFQIEHFHLFPIAFVFFIDDHILEVDIQSRHIDLNITSGFEFQIFTFRQFYNEFFQESRNIPVGNYGTFPFFDSHHGFRNTHFDIFFHFHLTSQTPVFVLLFVGEETCFGREDRTCTRIYLAFTHTTGTFTTTGRGQEYFLACQGGQQ